MKKGIMKACILMSSIGLLGACDSNSGSSADNDVSDYPNEPISLIVPYPPGGGTDLTARLLQPYLEDELGVSVTIENREGGGGWVGWGELAQADPDGYTIGYMNMPNVILGYLNPQAERNEDLESFDFLMNHMIDSGAILISSGDDRFEDVEDFIQYAQENEVTITSSGIGTANHFLGLQLNDQLGTNFNFVHMEGGGEAITSLLGGHVDALIMGLGETYSNINSGEFEPLAVFGDERASQFPDVPTLNEAVDSDTNEFITRGIAAPAGLEPEVQEILEEALENAINNSDHIEEIEDNGMETDAVPGEEYIERLNELEADIIELEDVIGW